MTEKCEYVNLGSEGDCGQRNAAAFVVVTTTVHCTPGRTRFFCESCLAKRGRSTGRVRCGCREVLLPHLSNIVSIVRIPKEN